jgi:ketosteroid isomerase-like protein
VGRNPERIGISRHHVAREAGNGRAGDTKLLANSPITISPVTMIEREYIEAALGAFEAKDIEDASAVFAENGVFIDPHSPNEEYYGPQGVRRALEWMFDNTIEQLDFIVRNFWTGETSCVIEVEPIKSRWTAPNSRTRRCSSWRWTTVT